MLASLLHLGAGVGLAAAQIARAATGLSALVSPLRRHDLPWLPPLLFLGHPGSDIVDAWPRQHASLIRIVDADLESLATMRLLGSSFAKTSTASCWALAIISKSRRNPLATELRRWLSASAARTPFSSPYCPRQAQIRPVQVQPRACFAVFPFNAGDGILPHVLPARITSHSQNSGWSFMVREASE